MGGIRRMPIITRVIVQGLGSTQTIWRHNLPPSQLTQCVRYHGNMTKPSFSMFIPRGGINCKRADNNKGLIEMQGELCFFDHVEMSFLHCKLLTPLLVQVPCLHGTEKSPPLRGSCHQRCASDSSMPKRCQRVMWDTGMMAEKPPTWHKIGAGKGECGTRGRWKTGMQFPAGLPGRG